MRRILRAGTLGLLGALLLPLVGCIVHAHHRPPYVHTKRVVHVHGPHCGHVRVRGRWVVIDRRECGH